MKKLRIGVIYGGRSGEHEVSLRSARSVIAALDKKKYEVVPLAIDKTGRWLTGESAVKYLAPEARKFLNEKSVEQGAQSLSALNRNTTVANVEKPDAPPERKLDVVIPVLHGTYGEDGTIQGFFEMADVAYVGCGVLASSCGMDKITMKILFQNAGLPMCRHTWFSRAEWEAKPKKMLKKVADEIGFPCFVKPSNLGSSVGISRASDNAELKVAIDLAAQYDRRILVEEGLSVREVECAVIGNDEPEASLPGEYVVKDEAAAFLDYTEKYASTGHVEFVVPARITKTQIKQIQKMAVTAFKAIDGAGLSRVDFFIRRDTNELLINEINTIPGLTDVSGFPQMWEASGVPLSEVLDKLINLALERQQDRNRNKTSL